MNTKGRLSLLNGAEKTCMRIGLTWQYSLPLPVGENQFFGFLTTLVDKQ